MNSKGPQTDSIESLKSKMSSQKDFDKFFMSISEGEKKPIDFSRAIYEGCIAGGVAGVAVEAALYPIDTIKTRLQVARGGVKIMFKGLYSGLAGNLVGVLPASAIFIGVYEPTKQKLLKHFPDNLSAVAHIAAGAIGGAASSIVRVPTEVVKQRMQTGQFQSAPAAVRLILANEGLKGLFAGYGSFLLRDLPFDALELCIYEQLRIGYKRAAKRDLNDPENAMLGAVAGTFNFIPIGNLLFSILGFFNLLGGARKIPIKWKRYRAFVETEKGKFDTGAITGAVTTPLDVVKTRLMVQGSQKHYKGISDCVSTIVKEEGARALFKGIGPRIVWIGIGGSIFFSVLEKTKQILSQRHPQTDSHK